MDVVDFWAKQVAKWEEEKKCGLCWNFGAPLFEPALNIEQIPEDKKCCVNIFLTNLSFKEVNNYNSITGLKVSSACEWNFTIYALVNDSLGKNNYTEIKGYNPEESKWNNIYKPISECLLCDSLLDFCAILERQITITSKGSTMVSNYQSNNYNGWKTNYTFRILN